MKPVIILAALFAVSSVFADDAGDGSPVTTVTPVVTAPVASEPSPARIQALVASLTPEQISAVAASLANNPEALSAIVAALDESKMTSAQVQLFLTDLDGWQAVTAFVNQAPAGAHFGNWLDAARIKLRAKIDKDGYTPELLAEARKLMQEAAAK